MSESGFTRVLPSGSRYFKRISDACIAVGVDCMKLPLGNGRANLLNDPRGRGDASIRCHADRQGGTVYNYKRLECAVWREDSGQRLSAKERARKTAERLAYWAEEKERERQRMIFASETAMFVRLQGRSTNTHPYLIRKHIDGRRNFYVTTVKAVNLTLKDRGYRDDEGRLWQLSGYSQGLVLLIPLRLGGQIVTMQFIDEQGRKRFLKYGSTKGAYWLSRDGACYTNASQIAIAEGVATALSVDLVTGIPSIAAMSCQNLETVAKYWRKRLPYAEIIICSDVGNGEDQARKAARAVNARFALPRFTPELVKAFQERTACEKPTDMNDFYIATGKI